MSFSAPFYSNDALPVRAADGSYVVSTGNSTLTVEAGSEEAAILDELSELNAEHERAPRAERINPSWFQRYDQWSAELPERYPGFFFRELEHRPYGAFRTVKYVERNDPCDRERVPDRYRRMPRVWGRGAPILAGVPGFVSVVPVEKAIIIFQHAFSRNPQHRAYAKSHGWDSDALASSVSRPMAELKAVLGRLRGVGHEEWGIDGRSDGPVVESAWNTNTVPFYRAHDDGTATLKVQMKGDAEPFSVRAPAWVLAPLYVAMQGRTQEMALARNIVMGRLAERGLPVPMNGEYAEAPGSVVREYEPASVNSPAREKSNPHKV